MSQFQYDTESEEDFNKESEEPSNEDIEINENNESEEPSSEDTLSPESNELDTTNSIDIPLFHSICDEFNLTEGQRDILHHILDDERCIFTLTGPPGSGKSHLMYALVTYVDRKLKRT